MQNSPPIIILPSGEVAALPRSLESGSDRLLTCGLCATLCFAILGFGAVEEWSVLILQALSVGLFLFWACRQLKRSELQWANNTIYWPMLAFATIIFIQVFFHTSAYLYATRIQALRYVSYALLLFIAHQSLRTKMEQRRFLLIMSVFSILLAAYSLMQFFGSNGKIYWVRQPQFGGVPFGPYANHNHYAGVMELLAPLPLVMSLSRSYGNSQRVLLAFGGCLIVVSIFICGSRSGMVACMIQFLVLAILLRMRGTARKSIFVVGLFLLLILPLVYWLGQEAPFERIRSLKIPTQEAVTGYREIIVRDGIHMFRDRPLLGWGLGTFPVVYPKYRTFYTNLFVNQAHNDYLQLLDETGIVGFGIGLWFLFALYRSGLRTVQSGGRAGLAALVGCTGIVVHSLTDFNLQIPANAALFFVLCGIATTGSD